MFIPIENIATYFSQLLDQYPVSPYLDSRDAFIRWMHFIHNKINQRLEKPSISLSKFYEYYYEQYKPNDLKMREYYRMKNKIIYFVMVAIFIGVIVHFYNK